MADTHAYCADCGKQLKKSLAKSSNEWQNSDEGWLCPHCNPDSETSW